MKHWCTQVYSISFELFHLVGLLYCSAGLKKSAFREENYWFTSIQALAQPSTLLFKAFNDCWGILWADFGEKNNIILGHYAVISGPLDLLPFKILWSFFFLFKKRTNWKFIYLFTYFFVIYGTFVLFCFVYWCFAAMAHRGGPCV